MRNSSTKSKALETTSVASTDNQRITVLLADDHTLMREMTRQLLEQAGMEVVAEAGDGAEAVALAQRYRPDVVLMDIAMPVLNGVEATRQIKNNCALTKVLILTAYDDDSYIFALMEAGAAGFLMKSMKSCELVESIRRAHAGESVLHQHVTRKLMDYFSNPSHPYPSSSHSGDLPFRQKEVLLLAAKGKSNKEIAVNLNVSERTVQAHLGCIFNKLGATSRTEAVTRALQKGWFRMEDLGED